MPFRWKVLSDLACLALNPLPARIIDWASSPSTPSPDNSGTDEIQRMEAIRVVASADTIRAFDVLLHSQYTTLMGHTLADSADGLAYLAVTLARQEQHRDYIVSELFKVLDIGPSGPQPSAVSSSIMDLSFGDLLGEAHYKKVVGYLLAEPDWVEEPVVKSRLAATLSSAPLSVLNEDLVVKLKKWAIEGDRMLATSSLETLIKHDLFQDLAGAHQQKLVFTKTGSLSILQPRDPDDVNGGIYAMLAYRDPAKYENEFASFIKTCAFGSLLEAMETLGRLKVKDSAAAPFPIKWSAALVVRALESNTAYSSESHTFVFLEKYAPQLLASTLWAEHYGNWTPETREALAAALGRSAFASESTEQAIRTLSELLNDTHFGVRRAAFRSLGCIAPSFLGTMVGSLATSESPDNRKLAAEALFWIPAEELRRTRWKKITEALRQDVAEDVRDSLKISYQRARKITWARKYEEELTTAVLRSNKEILKLWKYAEAISHVGDDESVKRLSDFLQQKHAPASAQRFLIRAIERLQKNWEKCRQKWPQPFAPGSATTRVGRGKLTLNGVDISITYLVWQKLDVLQSDVLYWGGKAHSTEFLKLALEGEKLVFTDADGEKWDIWVNSISPPHGFAFVGGDRFKTETSTATE